MPIQEHRLPRMHKQVDSWQVGQQDSTLFNRWDHLLEVVKEQMLKAIMQDTGILRVLKKPIPSYLPLQTTN